MSTADDASDMDISDTADEIMHRRERSREDIPIISELINGIQRLADGCVLRSCGGITPPNRSRSNSPHTRFTSQATPSTNGTTSLSQQQLKQPPSVPAVIIERFSKCISGGILQLGFQDVSPTELYWILIHLKERSKANHSKEESSSEEDTKVFKIVLAGNRNLSDSIAEYLYLLPDTVCDLDLSYCGLSSTGIRYICQFMENNSKITRLLLWGNVISVAGALYIRDMLKKNTTLEEFCCYNDSPMPTKGKLLIANGLEHNRTIKQVRLDDCQGVPAEPVVYTAFRQSLERLGNSSSIHTLEIGPVNRDPNIRDWAKTVERCENLNNLGVNSSSLAHIPKYMYWLNLNICNARKVTREGQVEKLCVLLAKAVKSGNDDVLYYLIRNNVEHLPPC